MQEIKYIAGYTIEFPEEMSKDEIEWINNYVFKFYSRHSCVVKKSEDKKQTGDQNGTE